MKPDTPETTLAQLIKARASMLDPLDFPGTWTPRQRHDYALRTQEFDMYIHALRNVTISTVDDLYATRDELQRLKTELEKQINEDWRTIADTREQDKAYERQRLIPASLKALQMGVEYWPTNGAPKIPQPLYELMKQPPCTSCGHTAEVRWLGTIPEIDAAIVAREKQIADERASLEALMKGAAALLADPVTV